MCVNNRSDISSEKIDELIRIDDFTGDIAVLSYNKFGSWLNEIFSRTNERAIDLGDATNVYYQFQAFFVSLCKQRVEVISVMNYFDTWSKTMIHRKLPVPDFFELCYAENPQHLELILRAAKDLATNPQCLYQAEIIAEMRQKAPEGHQRKALKEFFLADDTGVCFDIIYAATLAEAEAVIACRQGLNHTRVVEELVIAGFRLLQYYPSDALVKILP